MLLGPALGLSAILFSIGAAFWGVVAGIVAAWILGLWRG